MASGGTGSALLLRELEKTGKLSKENFAALIENRDEVRIEAQKEAQKISLRKFGREVFHRALIECTNCCANNCSYCGIRHGNAQLERYRLAKEEILKCCENAARLSFKTFVLQGGEDAAFSPDFVAGLIREIKKCHPDCAVTLSLGEQADETYRLWKEAGADRYLLRHESADDEHYRFLHAEDAPERTAAARRACLYSLKALGYQCGSGFMVGSPLQTAELLAADLVFLSELKPEMVGIGPFIPHKDTPFAAYPAGTAELCTFLLSVIRIMLPDALIPATTALATIAPDGREQGILAGANVVMPNVSPVAAREKYALYEGKAREGAEAAEGLALLEKRLERIGYTLSDARGDHCAFQPAIKLENKTQKQQED